MISVLTVSKRRGWEKLARESLNNQTYKNFEWVIVTEDDYKSEYFEGAIHLKAPNKIRTSNLSASNNHGLKHCEGKYIIFYQDFIKLPPDCFEKLLELATPKTFVTTCTINPDGSNDVRYLGFDLPRPCLAEEWEENVGLAPLAILKELGGYDEEYDNGWAWNNCNVAERAEILGCNFILDESNNPLLLAHDIEQIEPNGEFHAKRMREIRNGTRPLKLNYI